MLQDYLLLAVLLVVATIFPIGGLITAFIIRPHRPGKIKGDTYECGLETIGETWVQFRVQYYIYALVFLIFDIETIFLLPWAVAYNQLGLFSLIEMFIFLALLLGGLVYAWRKGALEWI
ncbi:MAG: NADH-quinone oxidoreductase subunit A [Chloroflexi bacterium]|nr:NADH-quinone oxidoreductase subunit A [Chloroflexota bacterium]